MENFKTIEITKKIVGVGLKKPLNIEEVPEVIKATDVKLPSDAPARMKTLKAEGKKWYLTVVHHEGTNIPFALFCQTNHKEKSISTNIALDGLLSLAKQKGILEEHISKTVEKCHSEPNTSKLTRVISLLLRHGVHIKNIVSELDKIDPGIGSFLFQLKKLLSSYIKDGEKVEGSSCSECGGTMIFSEGCMMCTSCGSSKCG